MSQTVGIHTYARARGVVWRLGAGRVLVYRVSASPELAAMELAGRAAFVWVALDEPGTIEQIVERLTEVAPASDIELASHLGQEALCNDVQLLINAGLVEIVEVPGASDGGAGQ